MARPISQAATIANPVRITAAGQVSIPRPILKTLGIGPGTLMSPEVRGGTVVLTPKTLVDWDAEGIAAAKRSTSRVGRSPAFATAAEGKRWMAKQRRASKKK